ncbi:MAG: sugar phosphate isomerase/epimerase family protein [Lacipirellulaceae bacterium]
MKSETWPLGVFTSVDAGFGVKLEVAAELGVPTMHLHAPSNLSDPVQAAQDFRAKSADFEIEPTVIFTEFGDESYESIPIVKETVGLVPESTREKRFEILKRTVVFAEELEVDAVGLHLGFVPHDSSDPAYGAILETLQDACTFAKTHQRNIHLETGQEPADVLLQFLKATDRANLFINFDPANMILYGCGEPLPALEQLAPFVRSVHCKDAISSGQPGVTWGEEKTLGEGDVGMLEYLQVLKKIGYEGPLTIEREISQEPERQKAEIGNAVKLLERLKQQLL